MKYFDIAVFLTILLLTSLFLISNFFDNKYINFFPKIKFGLDIKGGTKIVVKIDNDKLIINKLNVYSNLIKEKLSRQTILFHKNIVDNDNQIIFKIDDRSNFSLQKVKDALNSIDMNLSILSFDKKKKEIKIGFKDQAVERILSESSTKTINVLRNRLNNFGTKDIVIKRLNRDRIIIEISGSIDSDYVKNTILKTANLAMYFLDKKQPFVMNDENLITKINTKESLLLKAYDDEKIEFSNVLYNLEKNPVIYGDFINKAEVDLKNFKPSILISMNKNAALIFSKITKNNINRYLAIVLDDKVITSPSINQHIPNGEALINGSFDYDEASKITMLLNSGSLDTSLEIEEESVINPSLSKSVIKKIYKAMIFSFIITSIIMIFFYKVNGVIATVSIAVNILILLIMLSFVSFAFTLPSITGLLLTIGMSVDANIVIYEELKYKIKQIKKSQDSELDKNKLIKDTFSEASEAILDSNLTTAIVALVLISIGTGFIRGFGISVLCGIFTSLFSCFYITKKLMLNKFLIKKIA